MRAIRLSHGTIFVTDGIITVRYLPNGECGISPTIYPLVERDVAFEDPDSWDYMTEAELRKLPDGVYDKICAAFKRSHELLGI